MRKILTYLAISVVVVVVIFVFISKSKKSEIVQFLLPPAGEGIEMCYLYSKLTPYGSADRVWLKMSILDDKVTGEYQYFLDGKDSRVGKFDGTVGKMDPKTSRRIADVLWDAWGEGENQKTQLNIEFDEGSAVDFYGEMVDRGDGVYVYKDANKLTPGLYQMPRIDCEALIVEKYIRDNIKNIAPEKAELGGSWYITSVNVNPSAKTGTMTLIYEDGRIRGSKSFSYIRNNNEVKIILKELVVCAMDTKQCSGGSYAGRTGPNCEFVCPQ